MQAIRPTDVDADTDTDPAVSPDDHDRERPIPLELEPETVDRLERLREEGQSYDELITELIDIYESTELSLAHAGDAI